MTGEHPSSPAVMPVLDRALRCADHGWPVFPITPGGKTPALPSAHPDGDPLRGVCHGECGQFGHGFHDATTDPAVIRQWWQQRPAANLAVSCGPAFLVVIDLDTGSDGRPERTLREQEPGQDVPRGVHDAWSNLLWLARRHGGHADDLRTLTVTTPSGGRHLFFTRAADLEVTSGAGMASGLGWLIDVRAVGGFIVTPPSQRPDGAYVVSFGGPANPLPGWLIQALAAAGRIPSMRPRPEPQTARRAPSIDLTATSDPRRHSYLRAAVAGEIQNVLDAAAGELNEVVNRAAYALGQLAAGAGLDEDQVADALLQAASQAAQHGKPFNPVKTAQTIRSGMTAGARTPRSLD